jgi:hypothetical protein
MRFLRATTAASYLAGWNSHRSPRAHAANALHRRVIEALADEMNRSFADLAPLYEKVLADLQANALITDYVPIFASRRVKDMLKRRTTR